MRRWTVLPEASRNSAPSRVDNDPVALLEIGDAIGERRERQRVRAEIHLALAVADGERRALARADQKIVLAIEEIDEGERAAQALEPRMDRVSRASCLSQVRPRRRNAAISESVSVAKT